MFCQQRGAHETKCAPPPFGSRPSEPSSAFSHHGRLYCAVRPRAALLEAEDTFTENVNNTSEVEGWRGARGVDAGLGLGLGRRTARGRTALQLFSRHLSTPPSSQPRLQVLFSGRPTVPGPRLAARVPRLASGPRQHSVGVSGRGRHPNGWRQDEGGNLDRRLDAHARTSRGELGPNAPPSPRHPRRPAARMRESAARGHAINPRLVRGLRQESLVRRRAAPRTRRRRRSKHRVHNSFCRRKKTG